MSQSKNIIKVISFFVIISLLSACGGNKGEPSPADNGKDRKLILTHWVDNIIVPSYENFKVKFDALKLRADAFTVSPNSTSLTEFRSAWVDAYIEWQKVELFEFGPADQVTLRNFFNIYPTDVTGIETTLNDPTISLEVPAAYARQGFPALDYLINGVGVNDADIVAYYTTGVDAAKRIAYVNRLIDRMNSQITSVVTGWKGPYRDTFISKTGLDIGSSMGIVVNSFVLEYERYVRSGKIGIPSGSTLATGGIAYPDKVEGYYKKDISFTLAQTAHLAAINFFNGVAINNASSETLSFKSYLDALRSKDAASGTPLSTVINDQFTVITSNLNGLQPDFTQQIQTNNQALKDTYTSMQKLVRILKVDMTSAMSVTITYTDNDGD